MEGDGADDGLRGQDGAADEQHVRLLLAERVDAREEANPAAGAVVRVVGSGGRQHGVALPLDAPRDELPKVAESDDPHPQRRRGRRGQRRRRGGRVAAVARDGLLRVLALVVLGRRGEWIRGGEGGGPA